jgi:single-stranded DNA-binding protein
MARINEVSLIGEVLNSELVPTIVTADKTDGQNHMEVLNFKIRCYNKDTRRYDIIPVAVWGEQKVRECMLYMKKGDVVYVFGELRYKSINWNHKLKTPERVIGTVKATTVEFLSKKLKDKHLSDPTYSINSVRLSGNLASDPIEGDGGFIIAIDRLYPSKDLQVPNHKLTDYVTVIVPDLSCVIGPLKKGSMAIIEGSLMTRRMNDEAITFPSTVVDARLVVGGVDEREVAL